MPPSTELKSDQVDDNGSDQDDDNGSDELTSSGTAGTNASSGGGPCARLPLLSLPLPRLRVCGDNCNAVSGRLCRTAYSEAVKLPLARLVPAPRHDWGCDMGTNAETLYMRSKSAMVFVAHMDLIVTLNRPRPTVRT